MNQLIPDTFKDGQEFVPMLNDQVFHSNPTMNRGGLNLKGYMDDQQLQSFMENVVVAHGLDDKRQ